MLEKDGTLVANQVFRRDLASVYVIQIQVSDTGFIIPTEHIVLKPCRGFAAPADIAAILS